MRMATTMAVLGAIAGLCGSALAQDAKVNGNAAMAPTELPTNLVKILRTSNKAQTNRYVPKVYEFKNVNPYAVIRFVRRTIEIEESAFYSFANPDMNGGRLLVVVPEYQIPGLDALMATIDRPSLTTSAGSKRVIYRLKHRDIADAGVSDIINTYGTSTLTILADTEINAVFLSDAPSGIDNIVEHWPMFDFPTKSLEIQITVYEIDVSDDGQLGLDFISWKNGPGRNLAAIGAFYQKEKVTTFNGNQDTLIYNSGQGTFGLPGAEMNSSGRNSAYMLDVSSAFFDFLVSQGKARVMTQSKLVALNRTPATLTVGDQILFHRMQEAGDLRGGQRLEPLDPFGTLEGVVDTSAGGQITDTELALLADHPDNRTVSPSLASRALGSVTSGFSITFTPIINQVGATVPLVMSLVSHTGYADDGTPILHSHAIDTVFKVPHNGRTISIGGAVMQRRADSTNKVPFLGDLPWIGYLFGGESRLDQKTMVVTTMTCRTLEAQANQSDADLDLEQRAKGEKSTKAMENAPGFLDGVED